VFVDTVVFTLHQLVALIEIFGADHVLIGTDYPYDMAESDPLGHLGSAKAPDTKNIEAIAGGNANKLLDI
jgi:aminocarboxymuconate-semialdehyde decarboxylase